MPFFIDPNDLQNDDFRLQDEDGDLTLTHKATGATFKYDATDGGWIPSDQFGTEANPVPNSSHFEVVSTDELSNGVAGDGNTTTRVVADQGDTIPVHSVMYLPSENVEITSTSFSELGSSADRFVSFPTEFSLQNTGQIRARIAFRVDSVDSEVTLRLAGEDNVSLTATEVGGYHTDWVDNIADRSNEHFEGMVDSGSATVRGMTVVYGRQIE